MALGQKIGTIGNTNLRVADHRTPVEAILKANNARMVIASSRRFTELLRGLDELLKTNAVDLGNAHILEEAVAIRLNGNEIEILDGPHHTGTGFVVEEKDRPFGRTVEAEFEHDGEKKTLIHIVRSEDVGKANLMQLFEHGFRADGEGLIQLINARTGKPVITMEDLGRASEVILVVHGDIRNFKLNNREGGEFETPDTSIWVADVHRHTGPAFTPDDIHALAHDVKSKIGLLRRFIIGRTCRHQGGHIIRGDGRGIIVAGNPHDRCHVLLEEAMKDGADAIAPAEAGTEQQE